MMIERHMEAARTVVDRVVVAPPLNRVYLSHEGASHSRLRRRSSSSPAAASSRARS
ncbi:MAG: hypothetical protein R2748_08210 [Bryobacterales bacterium]